MTTLMLTAGFVEASSFVTGIWRVEYLSVGPWGVLVASGLKKGQVAHFLISCSQRRVCL